MKTLLILVPLTLIGCIPNRLVPHDFSIEENNIEAFIVLEDSITISLANLEIKNDHYVFGLGIQNHGSNPIFVDLAKVRKQAHFLSHQDKASEKYYQEVVSAMTPDQINRFFQAKKRNAQAAAAFLFLIGAAVATYDAVSDAKDRSKEHWTVEDQEKSAKRAMVTNTALLATDLLIDVAAASEERANTELAYLPSELFDREVIYVGEEYYGKVLFRKLDDVQKYHRISFPLENKNLIFDFRKATPKEKQFLYQKSNARW